MSSLLLDELSEASPTQPVRVGRYEVRGVIGEGGMGKVYEAVDLDHGTRVALKTLPALDPERLLRFKTEFRAVADLSHPNLVALYELGCHEGLWYFTMERVEGTDFLTWLRGPTAGEPLPDDGSTLDSADPLERSEDGVSEDALRAQRTRNDRLPPLPPLPRRHRGASPPPSLATLREAFAQLARGLQALHGARLLHLDIKPTNVLVEQRTGRVVVVDFGLVQASHGAPGDPEEPRVMGTPIWMAPERLLGVGAGEAADWYAVGLMLYVALTGLHPFPQSGTDTTWYAKRYGAPLSPSALVPGLPADLSSLALALLDADPARRPDGRGFLAARAEAAPEAAPGAPRLELVGRDRERALLDQALAQVAAGGAPAVVHLVGPSGVGKSALLDALVHGATPRTLVLRSRCYERETVPYKAFDPMLDLLAGDLAVRPEAEVAALLPGWTEELCQVFPVLARVPALAQQGAPMRAGALPAVELRRRAVEALCQLLGRLAERQPLVLAIDDFQWADADSSALLVRLLEAPVPRGLLVAVSFRGAEAAANPAVATYLAARERLGERADLTRLELQVEPLSAPAAAQLAQEVLASLEGAGAGAETAAAIAAEAAGLPYFVVELARHTVQQRGNTVQQRGQGPRVSGEVTLEQVLAERVRSLPVASRALVEVLAVASRPIPLSVAFAVAGIEGEGVLRLLWTLSLGHFVRSSGPRAHDRVELHHDRMREAVLGSLAPGALTERHLALGWALLALEATDTSGKTAEASAWLYASVRHLNAAAARLTAEQRLRVAKLNLEAAQSAQRSAAFPLAFACYSAGARLLDERDWATHYGLCLGLHSGAAETAALSAAWTELEAHVEVLQARGRTILDQLVAWEARINAQIGRRAYGAAVDTALEALQRLDIALPSDPGLAEIGAEFGRASQALAQVGPERLGQLAPAADPTVLAAMRIQIRIASAAYFGRPMLLPVLACRMVAMSVERGLSGATPYALALYGIVLNALGKLPEAHRWGEVALALQARFDDRGLEARTRHVVSDLVCIWTVPLQGTLEASRSVVGIGKQTGDIEYASYGGHAYVHNAFYSGARELGGLFDEALELGAFMRGYQEVNALHVHEPFEQVLRSFLGHHVDPACLDGEGYRLAQALEAARAAGSRSAQFLLQMLAGLLRYHFDTPAAASACFEAARPFLDGVVSTWHVPQFHQHSALAIYGLDAAGRAALAPQAEASLEALRALAVHGPDNFAHRVALLEGERARAEGDLERAAARLQAAADGAQRGGWLQDLGVAHERLAATHEGTPAAGGHRRLAREAYARWGAAAKVARLQG
jgi:predicted ATPase